MNRLATVLILSTMFCAVPLYVACGDDDDKGTCEKLDDFVADCYPSCAAALECSSGYGDATPVGQSDLDWCSDCLEGLRYCDDASTCVLGGQSCTDLMTGYLGVTCTW